VSVDLANQYVARANAYSRALVRRDLLGGEHITAAASYRLDALLDAAWEALPPDIQERETADNAWHCWAHKTATVYAAIMNRRRFPLVYAQRNGLQARWSAGTDERSEFARARWNRLREKVKSLNHEIEAKEHALYVARMAELQIGRRCTALVVLPMAA